ncbi:MAG: S1C family serine protease [Candidatus Electrothrix aestuarii]|uniref:S1C family serine protease n=1 Tax=Candidatus Electrothrix aestuarii TaxID=3062594 RepID=A0AAU8LRY8_9BACT|nr:S1C family serine protease [Candidatus Electrothrix aestuarii]
MKSKKQEKTARQAATDPLPKELPWSNIGQYIQLLGLLLFFGVVGSSYMKKEGLGPYASAQTVDEGKPPEINVQFPPATGEKGARTALALAEAIRPSLVSVRTLWGKGTGFFLQGNFILTCKRYIEPDRDLLPALQRKIAKNTKLLAFEGEKLTSYQARLKKMRKGDERDKLKLLISERKKYLADFRFRQEQDEQRLVQQKQAQEQPEMHIMLADGSEHTAILVHMSSRYDLALLRLASLQKDTILASPPPSTAFSAVLKLGELLVLPSSSPTEKITIHSFAGYRRIGVQNQMYLQLNAVIPQEKSGAPVLDATGFVRGVVISAVGQEEGAGFAVPIEKVLEEFAAVLQESTEGTE